MFSFNFNIIAKVSSDLYWYQLLMNVAIPRDKIFTFGVRILQMHNKNIKIGIV